MKKYQIKSIARAIATFLLLVFLFVPITPSLADTASDLQQAQAEQADLQAQLQDIENQIAQYQAQLKTIQGEKNTLQNKIKQLQSQQKTLNLQIQASNLQIKKLETQISDTKTAIVQTEAKIDAIHGQMVEVLRQIDERGRQPFILLLIEKGSFSGAITAAQNLIDLTERAVDLTEQAKNKRVQLDQKKQTLQDQQEDAKNLLEIKVLQQNQLKASVSEQTGLLQETKGRESNYQAVISDKQKEAAAIKSRLYELLGVSKQINFGEAVAIAQWASKQTGVRASFLLSVLTQESNLGKNVGTCNRPGDPPEKSWKVIMKPTRDHEPFKTITAELGMNIDITPVSCPMRDSRGNQVGWGGAMGPAQFIPSTWMGYRSKVTAITGQPANPWDIRDAFLASAIKLAADGAKTKSGEWAAAMKYFCGSTKSAYKFYGDSVVARAAQYESDIASLSN